MSKPSDKDAAEHILGLLKIRGLLTHPEVIDLMVLAMQYARGESKLKIPNKVEEGPHPPLDN